MTDRHLTHATFVIERTYDAPPSRVFAAFADPNEKTMWFQAPEEWGEDEHSMDFREGGVEISRGGPKGGPVINFESRFEDIVPDVRIVTTYVMHLGEQRMSVSLATVELRPEGSGTHLTFTESGAYLDEFAGDGVGREQGTADLLDALGVFLGRQPAPA